MVVDPFVFFSAIVILIFSLAMTAALFILNSNLEDQNRKFRDQMEKQGGQN